MTSSMSFGGDRNMGRLNDKRHLYPQPSSSAYQPKRPDRKGFPAITLYFINEDEPTPPHSLSCMYCKRTIMDRVVGQIDYAVNSSIPTPEGATAVGILCGLCGQRYRIVSHGTTT